MAQNFPDPPFERKSRRKRGYNEAKQYAKNLRAIAKDISDRPEMVKDWYISDLFHTMGDENMFEIVSEVAEETGLSPALIWSNVQEEGLEALIAANRRDPMQGVVDKEYVKALEKENNLWARVEKFPISGTIHLGVDTFTDRIKDVEKVYPGYFQEGVNYIPQLFNNEKGEVVTSANFGSVADGIRANAALLKAERDRVQEFAKESGIDLAPEQLDFFNYVAYNAGFGNARDMIKSYNEKGYLKDDEFFNERPDEYWKAPYKYNMRRITNQKLLEDVFYDSDILLPNKEIKPIDNAIVEDNINPVSRQPELLPELAEDSIEEQQGEENILQRIFSGFKNLI